MANKVSNFADAKNLREYLNQIFTTAQESQKTIYLAFLEGTNSTEVICYNLDIVWDGDEYYVSYTTADSEMSARKLKRFNSIETWFIKDTTA